mmetsp:Transcript_13092/g.29865  ORF Transcript_13092/g.29865 Transcript_13092/m.29865 type:complete len:296 (-) Transcript_13092:157-1044(-)
MNECGFLFCSLQINLKLDVAVESAVRAEQVQPHTPVNQLAKWAGSRLRFDEHAGEVANHRGAAIVHLHASQPLHFKVSRLCAKLLEDVFLRGEACARCRGIPAWLLERHRRLLSDVSVRGKHGVRGSSLRTRGVNFCVLAFGVWRSECIRRVFHLLFRRAENVVFTVESEEVAVSQCVTHRHFSRGGVNERLDCADGDGNSEERREREEEVVVRRLESHLVQESSVTQDFFDKLHGESRHRQPANEKFAERLEPEHALFDVGEPELLREHLRLVFRRSCHSRGWSLLLDSLSSRD